MKKAELIYFALYGILTVLIKKVENEQQIIKSNKSFALKRRFVNNYVEKEERSDKNDDYVREDQEVKYILLWAKTKQTPLAFMGEGREGFRSRNCKFRNCFTTFDPNFLGDITKFDAIVFSGAEIIEWPISEIVPKNRAPHQKYVFATIESPDLFPVCSDRLNNFFNWTWTYRLDSEAKWGYVIVRDADGNVIGPRRDMNWINLEDMAPVSDEFKMQLINKSKAAAWFASHCKTESGRELFVEDLQKALAEYDLDIDVYGNCGPYKCGHDIEESCFKLIKKYYYFYLAFENSFSEDYVTEKILYGLNNNAIPIVYGGANYTRFMPDGIYLNARELGPKKLARKMRYLIEHPAEYREYFRWKNHYTYQFKNDDPSTNDYCEFCELLNNQDMVEKTSIYKDFRKWWSQPKRCLYFGEHF